MIIITSLIIILAFSVYFLFNSETPIQGEHLSVSLQLQGYNPLPSNGSAVPLDLQVTIKNTGTQNVTITQISILNNNMTPVNNESYNYQLNTGTTITFYLVLQSYPSNCRARVYTSDGGIFDSGSL
jgi:hypothetical protein